MNISVLPESELFTLASGFWGELRRLHSENDIAGFRALCVTDMAEAISDDAFQAMQVSDNMAPFECLRRADDVAVLFSDGRQRMAQLVLTEQAGRTVMAGAQLA